MKHFRMVSFVVVPVKSHLANNKCSFDGNEIIGVKYSGCKVLINMIHGRDHSGNAGCATWEEEHHILEDLHKKSQFVSETKRNKWQHAAQLENISKLGCNCPVILGQLILLQLHFLIPSDRIQGLLILNCKFKHVVCWIPACCIMWHHLWVEVEVLKCCELLR